MIELSRRQAVKLGLAGFGYVALAGWPTQDVWASNDLSHGASPLGDLAYQSGFSHFAHRNPDAPKGGRLRLARVGAFDTLDTLRYPGRPPADMRVIYDRLVVASPDEPASYYGHLADGVSISEDFSRIAFRLHDDARWHDGVALTSEDVAHTFQMLKEQGAPFYRQAYRAVRLELQDERHFTFINDGTVDRDLISGLASLPIHPAHRADVPSPDALPLGSGPYRLVEADAPSRIVLERVPDYWAADLGTVRGAFNFDQVAVRYYRDATVAFEAFRAGEYDARVESNPTIWRTGYDDLQERAVPVRRATATADGPGRLHGLVMNVRSGPLADRRVRTALHLSFDSRGAAERLFGDFFQPLGSLFEGTAFASDYDPLADLPSPGSRDAARFASNLLDEAGYTLDGNQRIDPAIEEPVRFRAVSTNPVYEGVFGEVRLALERIGIVFEPQVLEPSIASRELLDRNFDLATLAWAPGRLPGSAERLLWHSDLASRPGSYALSGLLDPSVDESLDALSSANSLDEAIAAGKAFDRHLRQSQVYLPLWRDGETRIAWHEGISGQDSPSLGRSASFLSDWWSDDA